MGLFLNGAKLVPCAAKTTKAAISHQKINPVFHYEIVILHGYSRALSASNIIFYEILLTDVETARDETQCYNAYAAEKLMSENLP